LLTGFVAPELTELDLCVELCPVDQLSEARVPAHLTFHAQPRVSKTIVRRQIVQIQLNAEIQWKSGKYAKVLVWIIVFYNR
jgi:hypothetical protein